jgi:hypothetical protein
MLRSRLQNSTRTRTRTRLQNSPPSA